ncbi:type II toxin-antitoxin system RelE/ParE family toxin [Rhizobium sp.]
MRKIAWSDAARDELKELIRYIAGDDPRAARLVRNRIDDAVDLLAKRPIGRPGRVSGTYEKLVLKTSYIVAYAIADRELTIVHLIHDHRDWPKGRWPDDGPID